MRHAIDLAENGRGQVKPNPLVGCVLVKDGRVIAEGWHDHLGGLHAEQMAIADAEKKGHSPNGSTAYVTLEPCNHYGRTPPCTEALLWAGVRKVVIAHPDPNPTVRGNGISCLEAAGVSVRKGLLREKASVQMQPFLYWCEKRIPLVTLKIAVDSNGAVDDRAEDSFRFTSEESLNAVHRLRKDVDAIIVGIGTIIRDNPSLTVRRIEMGLGKQPLRVILDRELKTPLDSTIVNDGHNTLILHVEGREGEIAALDSRETVEVQKLQSARSHSGVDLHLLLSLLGDRGFQEVLLEGGPETARRFIAAGLVDRLIIIQTKAQFSQGFPLSLGDDDFRNAGLVRLGDSEWGGDSVQRWSREDLNWPAEDWP
nr:bifunctional diaminohydroxyphosphoribosylaminopyrimidine deaminase/5-amino-6-(5-phosphoribosylamino)uracil reductase RibD [Euryarchaeota archaeon]